MKTIYLILLFPGLMLIACSPKGDTVQTTGDQPDTNVALSFINDYWNFSKTNGDENEAIKWVDKNTLVTPEFKAAHRKLIEDARKDDEEMGLDFDPILNAQDFSETGYELLSTDHKQYVTVKAKDMDMTVLLKMKQVDGAWKVDGAGAVNIPIENE